MLPDPRRPDWRSQLVAGVFRAVFDDGWIPFFKLVIGALVGAGIYLMIHHLG